MKKPEYISLAKRKALNAKVKRKNNADLPAGSPMYYYCRTCGAEMTMPEDFVGPAPRHCSYCKSEGLGSCQLNGPTTSRSWSRYGRS